MSDSNPVKSASNLMDASHDAGLPRNLAIVASRKLLNDLAIANLQSELGGRINMEIRRQEDSGSIALAEFGEIRSSESGI